MPIEEESPKASSKKRKAKLNNFINQIIDDDDDFISPSQSTSMKSQEIAPPARVAKKAKEKKH